MTTYFRYSNSENPMSDYGHAMFVDDEESSEGYGENKFLYNGEESVNIEDLFEAITEAWNETVENGLEPIGFEGLTAEEVCNGFNPEDIVMSAEAWDSAELVTWFGEYIVWNKGIKAVITNDGAIVFDETLIKMSE